MARQHLVKCKYCGKTFDANLEPFVKPASNRYAHKACYDRFEADKSEEEKQKEELINYIKELFNYQTLPAKVTKQLKDYIEINKYSYSGILKSLKYHYEIKHGDKEKANGGIGIVPYIYENARNYYFAIWQAQQENAAIIQSMPKEDITIPTVEIHIQSPAREPMAHQKRLFAFLDEDLGDEQ